MPSSLHVLLAWIESLSKGSGFRGQGHGLSLRLSYYRQRVENVAALKDSPYAGLKEIQEQRDGGRYELRIKELDAVFGGSWASLRMWRTDVDEEEDAPVMGPETNDNTASESASGDRGGYAGVRVEGEFWRDEWIEHQGKSTRVRGDEDQNLPHFIVDTDGSRKFSADLNNEDIGRWLWFRPSVVNELLRALLETSLTVVASEPA